PDASFARGAGNFCCFQLRVGTIELPARRDKCEHHLRRQPTAGFKRGDKQYERVDLPQHWHCGIVVSNALEPWVRWRPDHKSEPPERKPGFPKPEFQFAVPAEPPRESAGRRKLFLDYRIF